MSSLDSFHASIEWAYEISTEYFDVVAEDTWFNDTKFAIRSYVSSICCGGFSTFKPRRYFSPSHSVDAKAKFLCSSSKKKIVVFFLMCVEKIILGDNTELRVVQNVVGHFPRADQYMKTWNNFLFYASETHVELFEEHYNSADLDTRYMMYYLVINEEGGAHIMMAIPEKQTDEKMVTKAKAIAILDCLCPDKERVDEVVENWNIYRKKQTEEFEKRCNQDMEFY